MNSNNQIDQIEKSLMNNTTSQSLNQASVGTSLINRAFGISFFSALVLLASCSTSTVTGNQDTSDINKMTAEILQSSFREEGEVKLDRLKQDETNRACSEAEEAGLTLSSEKASAIEKENLDSIKQPSDGKYIGSWQVGEKLAQDGTGMTWSDKAGNANGGNCYNCHQISKTEIAYGTIGPSLYQYGKLRGVTDVNSPASLPIIQYTWGKIWNAKATNACSSMPRFGHNGILNEKQIKDIMALLLDPKSPVNN